MSEFSELTNSEEAKQRIYIKVLGTDGLLGTFSCKLDEITYITVPDGTISDVCIAVKREIELWPQTHRPLVILSAGSFDLSKEGIGLVPVSHLKKDKEPFIKSLVKQVIDPVIDLQDFIFKRGGVLRITSVIPCALNFTLPNEYQEVLSRAYTRCYSEISALNKKQGVDNLHVEQKILLHKENAYGQKLVKDSCYESDLIHLNELGVKKTQVCLLRLARDFFMYWD